MAKNAEARYQSALGLKHDLQDCLNQWQASGHIDRFELGQRDMSARFLIPEQLYGREAEVQILFDAFKRASQGTSELMLVAGYSGVGKTAVVKEVHKPIIAKRGYFVQGKYDQFNRDLPFSAFVQALRDLMGQLLGESDAQLQEWNEKILEAVGENGQVLIEIIPELERIIGQQPSIPKLSGNAARNRFNLLFEKFIAVFTTQEHPLTLFLDDLQWADSASLNLLKVLMGQSQTGYLLVVGAYRDNEVLHTHPLTSTLKELEQQQTTISTITLAPLSRLNVNQIVAESLSCELILATPLMEIVYQKTKGNPFFIVQFLKGLYEDGLITFARNLGYWECDLVQVRAAALTKDVVEFMIGRLHKLPSATQEVLKLAACIGSQFDLETLAIICEASSVEVADDLWNALQGGLVLPQSETYKFFQGMKEQDKTHSLLVNYHFLHDRVQQAAYALIEKDQQQITHLNIGRLLLQKSSSKEQDKNILRIVNQLNMGISLIKQPREIEDLAQLNLEAAQKAKSSAAYQASANYLNIAIELLQHDAISAEPWQTHSELMLALHNLQAEVSYLNGEYEASRQQTQTIIENVKDSLEQVKAYEIRISLLVAQGNCQAALDVGLKILSLLDINLDDTPLPDIQINRLYSLPAVTSPKIIAALNILSKLWAPALICGSERLPNIILTMLNLSATHGNSAIGAFAYSLYGMLLCAKMTDIELGYSYGKLALHTLERYEDAELTCKVNQIFHGFIRKWKESIRERVECLADNVLTGLETGDIEFACYSGIDYCYSLFLIGEPLDVINQKQTYYIELAKTLKQSIQHGDLSSWGQMVDNLMGLSVDPTQLVGKKFDEFTNIPKLKGIKAGSSLFFIYTAKTILNYLFFDHEKALIYSQSAMNYQQAGEGTAPITQALFYRSLVLLSLYSNADLEQKRRSLDEVKIHQERLSICAIHAPENQQHKVDLVEAEKCRVLGHKLEALELYDKAIAGAKKHEYLQEEALANELAAKFYLGWGKEDIAVVYLHKAYYCYARWGAIAKTEQLAIVYPQLLAPILQSWEHRANPLDTFTDIQIASRNHVKHSIQRGQKSLSEALDFATVTQSAQLLSSNLKLNGLIAQLMQLMLTNTGAETCALILSENSQTRIAHESDFQRGWLVYKLTRDGLEEADSIVGIPSPTLSAPQRLMVCPEVPHALIHYVRRTGKVVHIDELEHEELNITDKYLLDQQPKSVLIQPIPHQGTVIGLLYLENRITAKVFSPMQTTVIDFFANQAGVALENARLYQQQANQAQALALKNQELQVAKQAAEIASDAKSHFLQNVSHELRTPLTGILGYSQILERSQTLSIRERQSIESIHQCGNNLLDLVNNVITITQAETEPLNLNLSDVHMPTLLQTVMKSVELQVPSYRIQLGCQVSSELPQWVLADEPRLREVLSNLLDNGLKFTEQGEVRLQVEVMTLSETHATIKFQVIDTGIGIAPADQANLFRLFQQVRNSQTQAGGLGVGLALSQRIVQQMGGEIQVESQLGQGSQFSFVLALPLCDNVPSPEIEVSASTSAEVEAETEAILSPTREELQALLELSQMGRLRKMRQQLEALIEKDKRYSGFVQPILVLERQFKVDEIEALLNQSLSAQVESS
ncbi:MAG: AAA family ATPase [Phormidesmis sp.]